MSRASLVSFSQSVSALLKPLHKHLAYVCPVREKKQFVLVAFFHLPGEEVRFLNLFFMSEWFSKTQRGNFQVSADRVAIVPKGYKSVL